MSCKRCGWALENWQKFCPGCGTRAPRTAGVWLWGGASLVLAGAIGLLGYRAYSLRQTQTTPAVQVAPAPAVRETAPAAVTPAPSPKPAPPPLMRIEEAPKRSVEAAAPRTAAPPAKEPEAPAAKAPARRLNIPREEFDVPVATAQPAAPVSTPATPEPPAAIPVVPGGPKPSAAPRPKIGILRPDRPEPPAVRAEPAPAPPAAPAQPAAPAPYTGPSAGTLIWSGEIGENTLVVINGDQVSIGRLTGELPGVPVIIQLETDDFMVIDPPGPGNGWKRLSLRSRKRIRQAVTIKWGVMK
jgi:hypothetical protein